MLRLLNLWDRLRSNFWLVPGLMALGSLSLALAMTSLDAALGASLAGRLSWIYSGGPEGARSVLSAIASSVMGVAGTTFSITTAVLSLTSGQFGPRLLRNFMRDLGNQIVLGTFTATFLYSLLVLRAVRGTEGASNVPQLSVTIGVILAVLSVGVLIYFVNHVAESIQVSHLIDEVGIEADDAAVRLFPKSVGRPGAAPDMPTGEHGVIVAAQIGYIDAIDESALLAIAERFGLVVRLEVSPGDYVLPEMPLLSVWPKNHEQGSKLSSIFSCGRRRTTVQDLDFALLQLSEVAVRALSPGINDPFTAMMCIDRITACMCIIAARSWPDRFRLGEGGALRVITKPHPPSAVVQSAYGHIRHAARDSPAVLQKLHANLETLLERAREPELQNALQHELTFL